MQSNETNSFCMQTKEEKYTALLHHEFGFWWTGFYRVAEDDMLVLGPFQGPPACSRIKE